MLSTRDVPRLKAKAPETRNLVPLCAQLVSEHPRRLGRGAALLKAAAEQLHLVYKTMQAEPRQMTPAGLKVLQEAMLRFLQYWKRWGGHLVYKHHAALHLAWRAS
eukprot:15447931-Alexandrium_andersonii.AAC.1